MKVNVAKSLDAMWKLGAETNPNQKRRLRVVKAKDGKVFLEIQTGKLTFCQRVWKWLGFANNSFNKVLDVILEIQEGGKVTQKGGKTDFDAAALTGKLTVLKGKIERYTPFFYSKTRALLLKRLGELKPIKKEKPKATKPQQPKPPLTKEECTELLVKFQRREFSSIDKQLDAVDKQLQFLDYCWENCHELREYYIGTRKGGVEPFLPLQKISSLWAQRILSSIRSGFSLEQRGANLKAYLDVLEKNLFLKEEVCKSLLEINSTPSCFAEYPCVQAVGVLNELIAVGKEVSLPSGSVKQFCNIFTLCGEKDRAAAVSYMFAFLQQEELPVLDQPATAAFERLVFVARVYSDLFSSKGLFDSCRDNPYVTDNSFFSVHGRTVCFSVPGPTVCSWGGKKLPILEEPKEESPRSYWLLYLWSRRPVDFLSGVCDDLLLPWIDQVEAYLKTLGDEEIASRKAMLKELVGTISKRDSAQAKQIWERCKKYVEELQSEKASE